MHDPLTVAWEIRRPFPRRDSWTPPKAPRWSFRGCFWQIAGRRYYWPSFITVWHVEPRGRDSGDVCKQYVRTQDADGEWKLTTLTGWRFHVHHWKLQVSPLQNLRRRALTRCAWCGGRSVKGNSVNVSHQWDGPRGRWWRGEPGLYHRDCSSVARARIGCSCKNPLTTDRWGECAGCGERLYDRSDCQREANRILIEDVPAGTPPTREVMNLVRNLWAVDRAAKTAEKEA